MTISEALKYGIAELNAGKIQEPIQKTKLILAFELCQNKEYLVSHDSEILRRKRIK